MLLIRWIFFILVLNLTLFLGFQVTADEYEERLYKHLMKGYIKDIRPTPDYKLTTNVTFGFSLHQLIDVDEKNQVITTSSWLNINWLDQKLTWNSSEFGDIKLIHLPADKVWRPDIVLTNNADPEYKDVVVSTEVYITDYGNVTWLSFAIFQSSCPINVRFYPFDDQVCTLTFSSWSYDGTEINIILNSEEGDLTNFMSNGEWNLLYMTANRKLVSYSCCDNKFPVITQTIKLRRRPLFYVFNHILPCVLITSMSLLGFYVPADTGEKVTMCITTMLSMGVFLKTINENLPPASEAVPLIGMYYGVSLMIVCAATLINVCTLNLHYKGSNNAGKPAPAWLRKLILGYMAKFLFIRIAAPDMEPVVAEGDENDEPENEETSPEEHNLISNSSCGSRFRFSSSGKPKVISINSSYDSGGGGKVNKFVNNRSNNVREAGVGGLLNPSVITTTTTRKYEPLSPSPCFEYSLDEAQKRRPLSPRPPMPGPTNFGPNNLEQVHLHTFRRSSGTAAAGASNRSANCSPSSLSAREISEVRKDFEYKFCKVLSRVYRTLEHNEIRISLQHRRSRIMWEWKQLATICDRLFLCLFVLATGATSVMMLLEPTLEEIWSQRAANHSHSSTH